jgi:hypothetical protein
MQCVAGYEGTTSTGPTYWPLCLPMLWTCRDRWLLLKRWLRGLAVVGLVCLTVAIIFLVFPLIGFVLERFVRLFQPNPEGSAEL